MKDAVKSFTPYGPDFEGGISVAAGNVEGGTQQDIITGPLTPTAVAASSIVAQPLVLTPIVKVFRYDDQMTLVHAFPAYDSSDPILPEGVFVAAGDVNGDGKADIIVGPFTGGSLVKVFSGADYSVIRRIAAFALSFTGGPTTDISGGVTVAAGYVNNDKYADIVTGTDLDGSHVKVFSGADPTGKTVLLDRYAFGTSASETFTDIDGGIAVAAADFDNDGRADVVASTLAVGPHVKVLSGDDGSTLPLTFPLLGSIVTVCGDINQTGYNGDIVLAGQSFNDTLIDGNGKDIDIGDNGVVVLVRTIIPIDSVALLSTGRAFPGGALFGGDALTPQLLPPLFVIPRIGVLGALNQTAVRGNVWLDGEGADNSLTAGNGDDVLVGNNAVVVQLSVQAVQENTPQAMVAAAAGVVADTLAGGSSPPEGTGALLLSLIGIVGSVTQVGVVGNVSVIGGAGRDTITAGNGNDFIAGDNAAVVQLTVGSAIINETGDSMPSSSGGTGTSAATLRLLEIGVLGNVLQTGVGGSVSVSGGAAPDTLRAGSGNDTVVGDNGIDVATEVSANAPPPAQVPCDPPGDLVVAETVVGVVGNVAQLGVGGSASLQGGAANNPVIDAGSGNNLLVGNNAIVVSDRDIFAALTGASSDSTGGGAVIDQLVSATGRVGQTGVFGGALLTSPESGDDTITSGNGNSTLIGDNAIYVSLLEAALASNGQGSGGGESSVSFQAPGAAADRIGGDGIAPAIIPPRVVQIGVGADVSLSAGAGRDTLNTQGGDVTLIGDSAVVVRVRVAPTADDSPVTPQTFDVASGLYVQTGVIGSVALTAGAGDDTLTAGNGNAILIGDDAVVIQLSAITTSTAPDTDGAAGFLQRGVLGDVALAQTGPGGQDRISCGVGNALLIGDSGAVVSLLVTGQANAGSDAGSAISAFSQLGVGGALSLSGAAGNDTITAATGDDTLIGDNGIDVSLVSGPGPGNTVLPGGVTDVTQHGVETDVTLVGDAANNLLTGGAGNDLLIGNNGILVSLSLTQSATPCDPQQGVGGSISLQGGGGNDTLDASAGNNQVLIGDNAVVVTVQLHGAGDCSSGDMGTDTQTGVAGDVTVNGLGGDDRLIGSNSSNLSATDLEIGDNAYVQTVTSDQPVSSSLALTGVGGDVLVEGGAGNDTLLGAAGGNTQIGDNGIVGVPQADVLAGRARVVAADGSNSIVGGAGNDLMFGHNSAGVYTLPDFVLVGVSVTGGDGGATLQGMGGDDVMFAQEGTASLVAGAGNPTLVAGPGTDQLFGGNGNDTYVFHNGWGQAVITEPANPPDAGSDTITFATVAADLTFHLNGLAGMAVTDGTDTVTAAGDHIQHLFGGLGNDTFVFADGAKLFGGAGTIEGGGGTNTLDYSAYTTAVTVNLAAGSATGTGSFKDIQTVLGGSGNDTLTGDAHDNLLVGNGGDDSIVSGGGNDTLDGGAGNNTLVGGSGDDWFRVAPNGGTQSAGPSRDIIIDTGGNDTLDLSGSPVGVTLNLDQTGTDQVVDASGDVLRINGQIENLIGSAFNDAITAGPLTVPRTLDGGGHTTVPPGNVLTFDAHGRSVTFTSTTITATGLPAVTYFNFDNFNFINQGALTVNSVATIGGTQGVPTDMATLATFSDQGGLKALSEYGAVIDWNDGTAPTPAALTISGGLLVVSGSHLYAAGGTYHPQVTLSDFSRSVTATATANITSRSTDVTSQLDIQRSGAYYNRRDQLFYGSLTLTNISSSSIAGSLVIRLVGLTAGVTLQYAAVTLGGQTYQLPVDNSDVTNPSITLSKSLLAALAPAQSVAIALRFSDPAFALIDFDVKVFSDPTIP
jgi:Ca2+-binding RTX toxin-like protein